MRYWRINNEEWELSQCSCRWWNKELIDIITLACKLASYIDVAYSAPLSSKRKPGRPSKTVNCLDRQGEELQTNIGDNAIEFCEEEVEEVCILSLN